MASPLQLPGFSSTLSSAEQHSSVRHLSRSCADYQCASPLLPRVSLTIPHTPDTAPAPHTLHAPHIPCIPQGNSSLALPHLSVRDITHVDWEALRAAGFQGCVFDKDNTLTTPFALEVRPHAAVRCIQTAIQWGWYGPALCGSLYDSLRNLTTCPVLAHACLHLFLPPYHCPDICAHAFPRHGPGGPPTAPLPGPLHGGVRRPRGAVQQQRRAGAVRPGRWAWVGGCCSRAGRGEARCGASQCSLRRGSRGSFRR